jgi:hypothetical protein
LISFAFFLIIPALFSVNKIYWNLKEDHFFLGDSNPGIVVQTDPLLVAVATDLSKGFLKYPVVKVIKCPAKGFQQGEIVSTVAVYDDSQTKNLPYWSDFNPVVVNCVTDDEVEIAQTLGRYTPEAIEKLHNAVASLAIPPKVGLYKVHNEDSAWKR